MKFYITFADPRHSYFGIQVENHGKQQKQTIKDMSTSLKTSTLVAQDCRLTAKLAKLQICRQSFLDCFSYEDTYPRAIHGQLWPKERSPQTHVFERDGVCAKYMMTIMEPIVSIIGDTHVTISRALNASLG